MKALFTLLMTLGVFSVSLTAQDGPAPSPASTIEQKVGLTDITVEYSRPSMKDRAIFTSDGLVPHDKIWRTGANSATKITFSNEVTIGDSKLAAGSYAILTKPGSSKWAVHFYPYDQTRFTTYTEATPAAAITVDASKTDMTFETFYIGFDYLRDNSAHLVFAWENTVARVPIGVK